MQKKTRELKCVNLNDLTDVDFINLLKTTPVLRLGWGNPEKTIINAWLQTVELVPTDTPPVFIGGPSSFIELREADMARLLDQNVAIAGGMSTEVVGSYNQEDRIAIAEFLGNRILAGMIEMTLSSLKLTFDGNAPNGTVEYGYFSLPSVDSDGYTYLPANRPLGIVIEHGDQILNVKSVENTELGAENRPFIIASIEGDILKIDQMSRLTGQIDSYDLPKIEGIQLIDEMAIAISENGATILVAVDGTGEHIVFTAAPGSLEFKINRSTLDGLDVISARFASTTGETLFLITEDKQILTAIIDGETGLLKNLHLATGLNNNSINNNVRGFIPSADGGLLLHTTGLMQIDGDNIVPTFSLTEIPAAQIGQPQI